jgi:hypothetical protein
MITQTQFANDKNLIGLMNHEWFNQEFPVSSVLNPGPGKLLFTGSEDSKVALFPGREMIGTTISVDKTSSPFESNEDDHEIGYYNDDYDLDAKAPISSSFRIKVKVQNFVRHHPGVSLDSDELI